MTNVTAELYPRDYRVGSPCPPVLDESNKSLREKETSVSGLICDCNRNGYIFTQMREMTLSEGQRLTEGHRASELQDWIEHRPRLIPELGHEPLHKLPPLRFASKIEPQFFGLAFKAQGSVSQPTLAGAHYINPASITRYGLLPPLLCRFLSLGLSVGHCPALQLSWLPVTIRFVSQGSALVPLSP